MRPERLKQNPTSFIRKWPRERRSTRRPEIIKKIEVVLKGEELDAALAEHGSTGRVAAYALIEAMAGLTPRGYVRLMPGPSERGSEFVSGAMRIWANVTYQRIKGGTK